MAKNPLLYRLTAVTAIVVVAGAALAGCSSSGGNTSSSGGSSDSIVLGSPGVPPVISGLLPYIADKQGFFKAEGLDVQFKLVGSGAETKVGTPTVAGATVSVEVLGAKKGPKTISFDYKRRKGYRNTKGHRQQYTEVKVTAINA